MMDPNDIAHGSITLELRERVVFATYSGVLDTDSFEQIEPRLQSLLERLHGHHWALVADVSDWHQASDETLARNAELLDACQSGGMRILVNVVSAVDGEGVNPQSQLRPSAEAQRGPIQVRDFRYLDEALAWLATVGY